MKKILIILMLLKFVSSLFSATVSGFVLDKSNGERIAYTSVIINGTNQGALTNKEGYFVINNVPTGKIEFFITNTAYKPQRVIKMIENDADEIFFRVELEKALIKVEGISVNSGKANREINTREIVVSNVLRTTKDLTDIPQIADSDVFRAIQVLPGVTALSDFSSGLYVRGGSPDQNLILLDDTDVYNPSHFGGIFSTFNTDAIEQVELMKGGFPAKYGGRLSSVLDVTNLDGNRKNHEGVARISLISTSSTIQGPWSKGSYMASFRRTYIDLISKLIDLEIPDYYFYDGHAKLTYDFTEKDKITVSSYFGKDRLGMDFGFDMRLTWGNETYTAQWVHIFNPQIFSKFVMAASHFNFNFTMESDSGQDFQQENDIRDYSIKNMFSYLPNEVHNIDFGYELKYLDINFFAKSNSSYDQTHLPDIEVPSYISAFYVQDSWKINDIWTIQPGVRLAYCHTISEYSPSKPTADYFRTSPRFSIRRRLGELSNIYFNYGRYYQFLTSMDSGDSPMGLWFPIDKTVEPGASDHYIFGFKTQINESFAFDVEGFYKTYDNLVEPRPETDFEWNNETGVLADIYNVGKGYSFGTDIMLRTDWHGIEGFIGYGFSVTKKKVEEINVNPQTGEEEWYFPTYDRNHQINVVETFNMTELLGKKFWGAEWKIGSSYSFGSGQPTTYPEYIYYNGDEFTILYGYSDRKRLPFYSRFDLSMKFKWKLGKTTIEPYLQVINLFNHENVWTRSYEPEIENNIVTTQKYDSNMFPRIPFIGVNVEW
ncbi:MAG: TonB-dependent receptor [Candidatus Cloacimonetes bacterium]|nr:TonB-dependent receptor [Candidatus Cloacimonadota bacterium]MCF7867331.1 TonB-dependent receptor [Candidatus Cloacimonadota bacterium]MCF7882765.1 TonB-dependent receptor [Candidatus Cloacimonadota bacterium]